MQSRFSALLRAVLELVSQTGLSRDGTGNNKYNFGYCSAKTIAMTSMTIPIGAWLLRGKWYLISGLWSVHNHHHSIVRFCCTVSDCERRHAQGRRSEAPAAPCTHALLPPATSGAVRLARICRTGRQKGWTGGRRHAGPASL